MNAFFHASLSTTNFQFDAYNTTADSAKAALIEGLKRHARNVKISPSTFVKDYEDGIGILEVKMGGTYIDRDRPI